MFLATLNKNDYALDSLSEYNPDMFAELLIEFNNYLLKPKKKDFIKILAEVESFYDSLGGNIYKYYFHKEFMWALALKKIKNYFCVQYLYYLILKVNVLND